jgi:butyrate kinase
VTEVSNRVLAINPGSTSTKIGVFRRTVLHGEIQCDWTHTIRHTDAELEHFRGWSALSQADFRANVIRDALHQAGYPLAEFSAFAGRGGLLPPMECGTYEVNDAMIEELRAARRGEHASNLGAVLAQTFAREAGVPAYIVDPVTVDEWQPCARLSGLPQITRSPVGHALNIKAVARRFARDQHRPYADMRLIVIHLGSGITVSAHRAGRMIDQNTPEEGPFGPDRSGWLPVRELIKLCFSGRYNEKQIDRLVFGEGGLYAYLGTRDLQEIEHRADSGDKQATDVYGAMIYKTASTRPPRRPGRWPPSSKAAWTPSSSPAEWPTLPASSRTSAPTSNGLPPSPSTPEKTSSSPWQKASSASSTAKNSPSSSIAPTTNIGAGKR